jgi:hypothetical protein
VIGCSALRHVATFRLCLARKPYLRETPFDRFKHEPLLVFRKD